jgi:hypothetical protein
MKARPVLAVRSLRRALGTVALVALATGWPVADGSGDDLANVGADGVPGRRNVPYGPGDVRKLDVHFPSVPLTGIAIIIYLH